MGTILPKQIVEHNILLLPNWMPMCLSLASTQATVRRKSHTGAVKNP